MFKISKISESDSTILSEMAIKTFLEAHSKAASEEIFAPYIAATYNPETLREELLNEKYNYHFIYFNDLPIGYSKIILDSTHPNIDVCPTTKLERIYILKDYYDQKLGWPLLNFNIELAKANGQKGMWLFTWVENHRAIAFYIKNGFEIIGQHDFPLSATETRLNHHMLLRF